MGLLPGGQVFVSRYVESSASAGIGQVEAQFLRPIRVLRALRILRAYRILSFTTDAVQRQVFMVLLTVVSVIVCTTGVVQALEYNEDPRDPHGQNLPFLDAMYFIVVTITTGMRWRGGGGGGGVWGGGGGGMRRVTADVTCVLCDGWLVGSHQLDLATLHPKVNLVALPSC